MIDDAYAELGVSPDASQGELRAAHRRLARAHHPDLAPPERRAEATRRMQRINVAYGCVRDPRRRAAYDELRADGDDRAWAAFVAEAGRWAGRWWQRHRRRLARQARRARRRAQGAGRGAASSVRMAVSVPVGAFTGLVFAAAAGHLLGVEPLLGQIAGALGGGWSGLERARRGRWRGWSPLAALAAAGLGLAADTALW